MRDWLYDRVETMPDWCVLAVGLTFALALDLKDIAAGRMAPRALWVRK